MRAAQGNVGEIGRERGDGQARGQGREEEGTHERAPDDGRI